MKEMTQLLLFLLLVFLLVLLCGCSWHRQATPEATEAAHEYDTVRVRRGMDGSMTVTTNK